MNFFNFASPPRFDALAGRLIPWLWPATIGLAAAGLYGGFFVAPTDGTQGDAYRIVDIHVPAASMSIVLYMVMACARESQLDPPGVSSCAPMPLYFVSAQPSRERQAASLYRLDR